MPIYEYGCAKCRQTFEVWQSMGDAPVQKCEKCGSKRVSRLISQTSFQLKGGGWYASGYASGGGDSSAGGDKPAASSTDSKPSSPTTEKKAEPKPSTAKNAAE